MKNIKYDAVIIGGGSAGMAAGVRLKERGFSVVIFEREETLGGILHQCIHNGFGLHYYKEELTGPEFAERFEEKVHDIGLAVYTDSTVMEIAENGPDKEVYVYSKKHGIIRCEAKAVVLAMGCRERNRGNIGTPGTRPAGVYTAGLVQRLVNIEGYIPGQRAVIVGSGDIGLIMARRMTWVGAEVAGVVELQPYPAGLTRNIVQCLNDFSIPLYLSHVVSYIHGKDRIEGVTITPLKDGIPDEENSFYETCDTLLLSVGLVPDNEISKQAGVVINPHTNGPLIDSRLMTSVPGIFACGNVLHVHDLVDYVAEEAERCGDFAADYMEKGPMQNQFRIFSGANVKYVVPNYYAPERENRFYIRSMIIKNRAAISVTLNNKEVYKKALRHVQPSEMVTFVLKPEDCAEIDPLQNNNLEVGLT